MTTNFDIFYCLWTGPVANKKIWYQYDQQSWQFNKIVDHSDEVGASPVGTAPTKSSFST